jgi:hypothetical protein
VDTEDQDSEELYKITNLLRESVLRLKLEEISEEEFEEAIEDYVDYWAKFKVNNDIKEKLEINLKIPVKFDNSNVILNFKI